MPRMLGFQRAEGLAPIHAKGPRDGRRATYTNCHAQYIPGVVLSWLKGEQTVHTVVDNWEQSQGERSLQYNLYLPCCLAAGKKSRPISVVAFEPLRDGRHADYPYDV